MTERKPAVLDLADLVRGQSVSEDNSTGRFHGAAASEEENPRPAGPAICSWLLPNRSGVRVAKYIGL